MIIIMTIMTIMIIFVAVVIIARKVDNQVEHASGNP